MKRNIKHSREQTKKEWVEIKPLGMANGGHWRAANGVPARDSMPRARGSTSLLRSASRSRRGAEEQE